MTPDPPGIGTRWVPRVGHTPQGSSVGMLLDAVGEGCTAPGDYKLATDLLLTGSQIDDRDRGRIKDVVQWRRAEVAE